MIKIEKSKTNWGNIEDEHKKFFMDNKKIDESLDDLKSKYAANTKNYKFLKYLADNLEDILIGKPDVLREAIDESIGLKVQLKRKQKRKNKIIRTTLNKRLAKVFNYDQFQKGPKSKSLSGSYKWTAYHLVDALGVDVCPYCNRIYTTTFYSQKEGRTRPHLDHYYSQSEFPFLGLSLYNLIPSCYSCNSSFKGDDNFFSDKHLHPYENGMGENIKFTLRPEKRKIGIGSHLRDGYDLEFTKGKLEAFNLEVDSSSENNSDLKDAWEKSNKTFHLIEMYESHKDILHEMIQKSKVYKEEYADWLEKKYVGTIFKSRSEIDQMIIGNYKKQKDFGKRPLAKLTFDISKELKLI